jgi:Gpi18-like mannosyltransferase
VIRILLSPVQGYTLDLATFAAWFQKVAEDGPYLFYETWCDYPPFNVYIFWVFGSLAKHLSLFGTSSLVFVLKLPSNIFDVATAVLIFVFLRGRLNFKTSILTASFYTFNPAIIFNTSIWGQFDAIYTFFLVLSLMLIINSKLELSVMVFAIGVLSKPQSVALAPLIAFLILLRNGWKSVMTSALVSAATILILIIPFKWSNPVGFLINIYVKGYGGYPFTSLNAFNLWAFHGFWKPDNGTFMFLDFFTIGWTMFGALTFYSLYRLYRGIDYSQEAKIFFTAFILLFGFFMLPTRIHERYLFPVFSVLTLILPFIKNMRAIYGVLTFTYFSNQVYVLAFLNSGKYIPDWDPTVMIITMINLATFLYILFYMTHATSWRRATWLTCEPAVAEARATLKQEILNCYGGMSSTMHHDRAGKRNLRSSHRPRHKGDRHS